jgi:septum formation protein
MKPLVLASTSSSRRALLDRLGIPHEVKRPSFEEIAPEGLTPSAIARAFAEGKARSVSAAPGQWVIGSDQVPEISGRMLRKAETLDECRAQLALLSGRTHALHAAVALWSPATGRMLQKTVTVELVMRPLSAALLDRYVELERPVGSAGGYFFEGRGVCLFEEVRGGDDSAIVGLPLLALSALLREAGLEPFSLME